MSDVEQFEKIKHQLSRQARKPRALRRRAMRVGGRKVGTFADVSNNNGPISRAEIRAYARNHDLIVVKVSEGKSYVDPYAAATIHHAKAEGLIVCPYHFARPDSGNAAKEEAAHFLHCCHAAGLRMGPRRKRWYQRDELPGCLDYEEPARGGNDHAWIVDFLHYYRHHAHHGTAHWRGSRASATAGPLLYGGSVVRERVTEEIRLLYWLAAYTSSPDPYWPNCTPKRLRMAWQKTDSFRFPGLGNTDASIFYGRVRDLVALAT